VDKAAAIKVRMARSAGDACTASAGEDQQLILIGASRHHVAQPPDKGAALVLAHPAEPKGFTGNSKPVMSRGSSRMPRSVVCPPCIARLARVWQARYATQK